MHPTPQVNHLSEQLILPKPRLMPAAKRRLWLFIWLALGLINLGIMTRTMHLQARLLAGSFNLEVVLMLLFLGALVFIAGAVLSLLLALLLSLLPVRGCSYNQKLLPVALVTGVVLQGLLLVCFLCRLMGVSR